MLHYTGRIQLRNLLAPTGQCDYNYRYIVYQLLSYLQILNIILCFFLCETNRKQQNYLVCEIVSEHQNTPPDSRKALNYLKFPPFSNMLLNFGIQTFEEKNAFKIIQTKYLYLNETRQWQKQYYLIQPRYQTTIYIYTTPKEPSISLFKLQLIIGLKVVEQYDEKAYREQFLLSPNHQELFGSCYEDRCSMKQYRHTTHSTENSLKMEVNEQKTQNNYGQQQNYPFLSDNTQTMNQFTKVQVAQLFPIDNSDSANSIQPFDAGENKKGRKQLWNLKGLSRQVKEIISIYGDTTYKSIADKLVDKLQIENAQLTQVEQDKEKQNLKRRVYDSINVMVSLGTLEKKGKVIRKGRLFIVNVRKQTQIRDLNLHQLVLDKRQDMIQKRKFFRDYTNKFINLQKLVERNKLNTEEGQVFFFPLVAAQTKLDPDEDPVLLNMSLRCEELRIFSKCAITVRGDLDILAKLKHLDNNFSTKEHKLQQFE